MKRFAEGVHYEHEIRSCVIAHCCRPDVRVCHPVRSWLIGKRYYKTNLDTQPVIILGVDNLDTTERRVLVEPGEK